MSLQPEHLRCIPLLAGFDDALLESVARIFEPVTLPEGATLFEVGDPATHFYVLISGEVEIYESDQLRFPLSPCAGIGELACLAGLARASRAVVTRPSTIMRASCEKLQGLLEQQTAIALPFYRNLVRLVAEKVRRDQLRLEDMRRNIIRTQKAMKQMRDYLLESQDTPISEALHNRLEDLIRHNRRVNYRVEPPAGHPAAVRLDDGTRAQVVQISRTHLSYELPSGELPAVGTRLIAVLCLGEPELPISSTVLRTINRRVDLELDLLLDEYGALLDGYLTRLQLLDFMA